MSGRECQIQMQCSRDKIWSLPIMVTDQNKKLPEPLGQHDIQDSWLKVHSVLETTVSSTTETLPQKTQVYYFNHRDPAPKDTGILLLLCWFHHMEKQATCLTARTETTPSELTLVTAAFARPASPMIWLTLACSVLLRGWKYSSLGTQNQMSSSQAWHFSYCTGWVAI